MVDRNSNYELSDIQVEGETASFNSLTISSIALVTNAVEALVQHGKIVWLFGDYWGLLAVIGDNGKHQDEILSGLAKNYSSD